MSRHRQHPTITPANALVAALSLLPGLVAPASASPLGFFFEDARLHASDAAGGDELGYSVAVSGSVVVVGAWLDDDDGNASGAAYVFIQPAGGWSGTLTEAAKLHASHGAAGDNFGAAVAISGTTIVVGAPGDDDNGGNSGSAYVFSEPPGGWSGTLTEDAKLVASDGEGEDNLADSVAVDGATIVAGARGRDTTTHNDAGAAYVFKEPVGGWSGILTEETILLASDGFSEDQLGYAVAVTGLTVVAGAPFHNDQGGDSGAVYVFSNPEGSIVSGTVVFEDAKLLASDGAMDDNLGLSVGASGGTIVAGAIFHDSTALDAGAAYVFVEPPGGWEGTQNEDAKLLASGGAADDHFGQSVAVAGGRIVVGAYNDSEGLGAAYAFDEPGGGWAGTLAETSKLLASDGALNDRFGSASAVAGGTIVVGAARGGAGGSAYVYGAGTPSVIFADGFESGDTGAWSLSSP
jgi:FG-GAP repeat